MLNLHQLADYYQFIPMKSNSPTSKELSYSSRNILVATALWLDFNCTNHWNMLPMIFHRCFSQMISKIQAFLFEREGERERDPNSDVYGGNRWNQMNKSTCFSCLPVSTRWSEIYCFCFWQEFAQFNSPCPTAKPLSPSGGVVRPRPALCDPGHLPLRHDQRRDPARGCGALRSGRGGWLGALMRGGFKVGVHGGNLVI